MTEFDSSGINYYDILFPIVTGKEMAEMDRLTIEEQGVPGLELMENAGRAVASVIEKMMGDVTHKKVLIFCGKGNNGGDGYVVARCLNERGAQVVCYLIGNLEDVKGDAKHNLNRLTDLNIRVLPISGMEDLKVNGGAHLVVDALLGTGVSGALRGMIAKTVEEINKIDAAVVSIDLPTGIETDTGAIHGPCVKADATVTMACKKRGVMFSPGREHCGKISTVDIGIPLPFARDAGVQCFELNREFVEQILPKRASDTFKNRCGQVLVLAGSVGLTGAAALSSAAVLRSGAGMAILGIPESLNPVMEQRLTEVMTLPLPETESQSMSFESKEVIYEKLDWADVLAVGPGLSTHEDSTKLVTWLLETFDKPMVLDADALNCISEKSEILSGVNAPLVITPHPGELSRIIDKSTKEILADPVKTARESAKEFNCVVVLKGGPTVVASPDGFAFINSTGNPGMATAGMGDVLTGVIAGVIAQGVSPLHGALIGVYLHGLAGDLAAAKLGQAGLIAGDVLEHLPFALKYFEDEK